MEPVGEALNKKSRRNAALQRKKMQLPIVLNGNARSTLAQDIFNAIRTQILSGRLVPGLKLPGSRELSLQLGVARNTVLAAYAQLNAEGYISSNSRAGTFVTLNIPESTLNSPAATNQPKDAAESTTKPKRLPKRFRAPRLYERKRHLVSYDFRIGRPDISSYPLAQWRRQIDIRLAGAGPRLTHYGNPAGLRELRQSLAAHLKTSRGIRVDSEQIIIVRGCQEGLNIIARLFSDQNTVVGLEDPCYRGAAFVFEGYGYKLHPTPVDEEGIVVDRLPDENVSLVYVTPSHQFPMGVTMSLNRRLRLLDWAKRSGAYIVEDDYDSDFRYNGSPLTALHGLDSLENVIYIGTFSKSIGAGIRIGYLVLPEPLVGAAIEVKALTDNGSAWLEQAIVADFINSGSFGRHLRRIRSTYSERRNCLIDSIKTMTNNWTILGSDGGMHLTAILPESLSARSMQYYALDRDVGVYSLFDGPAVDFRHTQYRDKALFFGYPCLSPDKITEAVRRLSVVATEQEGKVIVGG